MLNGLTIDVEEFFHAHAYESAIDRATWERQPSRVARNTRRILDLLDAHETRATFFVLGWVAEREPALVQDIAARGHEIGTHGHAHQLVYRQSRDEFAADVETALAMIRRALGDDRPIAGYRAPAFSITNDTLWALDVLREHGFRYDSSILPLAVGSATRTSRLRGGKRSGVAGVSRFASKLRDGLWEFPLSTIALGSRHYTVAGGGMFRLLPLWATRACIRRINAEGHPAIVYLHPWEFDPEDPDVPEAPALARFRHRLNLRKTEARLGRLLADMRFAPLAEVFATELQVA
jgi:polysaccharide deacetylase family protein (PEP-CTERM system associated)